MTLTKALDELEAWTARNHDHHYGLNDPDIGPCCEHADRPYVDSLDLVAKIRELRKQAG